MPQDPLYEDVGETQKTKDYIALKKEEEKIAKETGKDYSKLKPSKDYEDVGETQKTKDYIALKKEEEKIEKETGKDYSKVK
jgi:hypothetical protein